MNIKLAVLTAGFGCTLAGAAFAMPMATPSADTAATPVRMICNEYGRCWDRADNPGEAIARGVVRGLEGRSVYRGDRDFDHDRGLHRGWDRDRGYGSRHRWDDDD
ncbi:MAG: hypothetical protein JOZ16_09395 [Methylobacteriaceae bacterium]|nr:hypothetical protein [Methylobacteriaceae bacterium]